ncbi:hypothetical protein EVAR_18139_1 [Eumeta japonica]|uniref:Uncharacterized protein n=1 Tax=Eumeta variegata TaxID=151549 RepID=A0A4C1UVT0_EUMVA|nr:hypothetical protein EVAR_18139_1 [Eumeta japonica]
MSDRYLVILEGIEATGDTVMISFHRASDFAREPNTTKVITSSWLHDLVLRAVDLITTGAYVTPLLTPAPPRRCSPRGERTACYVHPRAGAGVRRCGWQGRIVLLTIALGLILASRPRLHTHEHRMYSFVFCIDCPDDQSRSRRCPRFDTAHAFDPYADFALNFDPGPDMRADVRLYYVLPIYDPLSNRLVAVRAKAFDLYLRGIRLRSRVGS